MPCFSTTRLFGAKASSKPSSPGTPDSGKCPSALGSPHGTLARQTSLDSPSSGTGSLGSAGGQSGGSSPLYGKAPDLGTDSPASSPASGLSLPSNARPWPTATLSSSSAGSKDTLSCQSMTSLHTSSESIDLPLGHHHGPKVTRTGSVKSTLSEGWVWVQAGAGLQCLGQGFGTMLSILYSLHIQWGTTVCREIFLLICVLFSLSQVVKYLCGCLGCCSKSCTLIFYL